MIRIFTPNPNGNIELTKEELEKLLLEAYNEGKSAFIKPDYYKINEITSPPYNPPYITWTANTTPSLSNLNTVTSDSTTNYTITAKSVEVKADD